MRRPPRTFERIAAIFAAALVAVGALGHGAAVGLHVHVSPEPAAPGESLTVDIQAIEPMVAVRLGVGEADAIALDLEEPSRRHRIEARMPRQPDGETVSVRVEAETTTGRTLRASAVVPVRRDEEPVTPRP